MDTQTFNHLNASVGTLADVLARVESFPWEAQARANVKSGIKIVARVLGRPLELISLSLSELRKALADASPAQAAVSPTRWRNAKSELNRALKELSLVKDARLRPPLDGDWLNVAERVPNPAQRSVLNTFGRYCTSRRLGPHEVTDFTIREYSIELTNLNLSRVPERTVTDLVRIWNRLAAVDERLSLISKLRSDRYYTLKWEGLPPSLQADAASYSAATTVSFWDADDGLNLPVRPATAKQRDRMIRRLASAAILNGVSTEKLQKLRDLVLIDHLRPGIDWMIQRAGGKPNKQIFDMLVMVEGIAKRWAKLDTPELEYLRELRKRARPSGYGMTTKNRERLQQFSSSGVIERFIKLPYQVYASLTHGSPTYRRACAAGHALMVAILTVAPMRLQNLRLLDRSAHFNRGVSLTEEQWLITIPAPEVKNAVELSFLVSRDLMRMIDHYVSVYRPLLLRQPTQALFPGRGGGPISDTGARRAIVNFVERHLGLQMNPHLFRHLCGMIFLRANPGEYETVRQMLGHRNIQTTINFYTKLEMRTATERYAAVLKVDQLNADRLRGSFQ